MILHAMIRPAIALALLTVPTLAQATEGRIFFTIAAETLRGKAGISDDQKVMLAWVRLYDHEGRAYDLRFDVPRPPLGVHLGIRGSCEAGAPLGKFVVIPFDVPNGKPPFTMQLELETPDQSQPLGCRKLNVSIDFPMTTSGRPGGP